MTEPRSFYSELEPLSLSNRPDKIKVLRDNPEKIVRVQNLTGTETVDELEAALAIQKKLFDELRGEYKIDVGPVDFLMDIDEKKRNLVYLSTDRIHGESLKSKGFFTAEEAPVIGPQLDELCANLTRYLADAYKQGKTYLRDLFRADQYMWGKRKGETQDKLYLKDLDPDISVFEKNSVSYHVWEFSLNNLSLMIDNFEHWLSKHGNIKLIKAREEMKKLLDFLKGSEPNNPDYERRIEARLFSEPEK